MNLTLTRASLALILDSAIPCPSDMREEVSLCPEAWEGGELWTFPCSAGTGAALRAPTGEGGIAHGGDTVWGTWAAEVGGLVFTASDGGVRYDARGVEIAGEASEGDWVDCGALEYGTVSARLDGEGVRISYTATDPDYGDEDHLIREAVESKLGLWIKTPSGHRWSAAEGDGEVVQTVARLEHQPTHEITQGGRVSLVCLIDGVGYERVDIESGDNADWEMHGDEWLFQGQRRGGTVRAL